MSTEYFPNIKQVFVKIPPFMKLKPFCSFESSNNPLAEWSKIPD